MPQACQRFLHVDRKTFFSTSFFPDHFILFPLLHCFKYSRTRSGFMLQVWCLIYTPKSVAMCNSFSGFDVAERVFSKHWRLFQWNSMTLHERNACCINFLWSKCTKQNWKYGNDVVALPCCACISLYSAEFSFYLMSFIHCLILNWVRGVLVEKFNIFNIIHVI